MSIYLGILWSLFYKIELYIYIAQHIILLLYFLICCLFIIMLGKKNYILSKLIHFKIIKNKLLYFSIITVLGNAVLFVYSLQGVYAHNRANNTNGV